MSETPEQEAKRAKGCELTIAAVHAFGDPSTVTPYAHALIALAAIAFAKDREADGHLMMQMASMMLAAARIDDIDAKAAT